MLYNIYLRKHKIDKYTNSCPKCIAKCFSVSYKNVIKLIIFKRNKIFVYF